MVCIKYKAAIAIVDFFSCYACQPLIAFVWQEYNQGLII